MLVGDGTHHGTHGEAVEVVIDEDEHTQQNGSQLRAHTALDVLGGPAAEGGGAARLVHQAHHGAQDDQEDQDAHVVAVRQHGSDAVLKDVKDGALEGEVGVKQAAHQDTDKQGGVDLLGDQSQGNGDDRGQQGKSGSVEVAGRGDHTFAAAGGAYVGPFTDSAGGVGAVALHADAVALAGRALHGGAASTLSGGKGHAHQGQNQDQRQHDPAQPASVHSHSSHFPPKISSTGTTNTHDISPGALAQQKTMNAKRAHGKTGCPLSAENRGKRTSG